MKRLDGNVETTGRPQDSKARTGVRGSAGTMTAGSSRLRRSTDFQSIGRTQRDPMATAFAEAALVEDFIDFLEDECDLTEFIAREPDPVFRERLRRRLWQSLGFGLSAQGLDIH